MLDDGVQCASITLTKMLLNCSAEILSREILSHKDFEMVHGVHPVLLTNVQCQPNATTVNDCTSGPMGFANCASGNDTYLACDIYGE